MRQPKTLDLGSLPPSEDGPQSELQARRKKFAQFECVCSEVTAGVYIGGEYVATHREVLADAGITHIVNCVGQLYKNLFPDLQYFTLRLNDGNNEDITSVLYDVISFIEAAHQHNGRVLLHCSQGVSRSGALAIAHLMWTSGLPFEKALEAVKAKRGIVNPNINFTCQLMNWHKRRNNMRSRPCLYSAVPHSGQDPTRIVLRPVHKEQHAMLDPRGAFLANTSDALFLWKGAKCPAALIEGARHGASGLQSFEQAAALKEVCQGEETGTGLWHALSLCAAEAEVPNMPYVGECPWLGKQYENMSRETVHPAPSSSDQSSAPALTAENLRRLSSSSVGRSERHQEGNSAPLDTHRSSASYASSSGSSSSSDSSSSSGYPASEAPAAPDSARQAKTPRDNSDSEAVMSPNARSRKIFRPFDESPEAP